MAHADGPPAGISDAFRPGTLRGVEGFFRAGQEGTGCWWMIDPYGRSCYVRSVHGVRSAGGQGDGALPLDAAARLRAWGFNAVGVGPESAGRDDGLPFMASVDFCRAARLIVAPGMRLPDVFEPEWGRVATTHARQMCASLVECPELIGWVTDDRLQWASPSPAGRPSLLQICLSLEPAFAAYHAAWEFVLALHGGRLDALARAWGASLPNKEVVRELTRADEGLGSRGYFRDEARWAREFARRYFNVTAAAIRAADPNHLVLGCRFDGLAGSAVLAECGYPAVDVALPNWSELPSPGVSPSHPVLASDVSWVHEEFSRAPSGSRTRRLTTVERMLRRARAAIDRMAKHPAVVGYAWSQWQDEPGEQPPFARGLVHVNGVEAREHTEVLAQFNLRVDALRRAASGRGAAA
jgi:agarase